MCCSYRQPALLIFIFISFIASCVLLLQINYFLSYGPMTLGQENAYYLSFAGHSLIIAACIGSIMLLSTENRTSYVPFISNLGFLLAAGFILASAIIFFNNPPELEAMQKYVLHKFVDYNENTPLMQRLQTHHVNEKGSLKCCGVSSYLDYTAVNHGGEHLGVTHIHVPDTCCMKIESGCGKNLDYPRPKAADENKIYQKGCLEGGVEAFMNRLDFFTHGFYQCVGYSVLVIFLCAIASMVSFNILYFCSQGNEIVIADLFLLSKFRRGQEPPFDTREFTPACEKKPAGDVASTNTLHGTILSSDTVPSGASTGNAAVAEV